MSDSPAANTREPDAARDGLSAINALGPGQARLAFLSCCASQRWASGMAAARPYGSVDAVRRQSGELFDELQRDDWLQAFAAHAAIGAPRPGDRQGTAEQAAVAGAGGELLDALRDGNARYRERFGHVFLIRARGRSAGELLAALHDRLGNTPEQELHNAVQAQREIADLRLAELLASR
jgi:OHCU decarboxylase